MNPNTPFLIFQTPPSSPPEGNEVYTIPIDIFLPIGIIIALLIGGYFLLKIKIDNGKHCFYQV